MDELCHPSLAKVRAVLGKPQVERSELLVYQADSLEAMRRLPDGCVALTVTSPPYNIGKPYEQVRQVQAYVNWCADWIREVHRITARNGAFWLNLGYLEYPERAKALPIPYLIWDKMPFYILQEIVWNYGAGVASRRSFSPRNEKFLWCVKNPDLYVFNLDCVRDKNVKYPNQKKNGKLKCNPMGKNPTDVWQIPKVTSGANRASPERTPHPAQFPVALVERIIKACSNPGDVVFDPFAGSGTTLEVAMRNDRPSFGVEIDTDYIKIISNRLRRSTRIQLAAKSQLTLSF
jgi:adenine-specific DNA-methyltransferase